MHTHMGGAAKRMMGGQTQQFGGLNSQQKSWGFWSNKYEIVGRTS